MNFDPHILKKKADTALEFLVKGVIEIEIIGGESGICETYERACREVLSRYDVTPRELGEDDIKHIAFEIFCFAVFIMTQLAPKYITRRRFLRSEPNPEAVEYFNSALIELLDTFLGNNGFNHLREVVVVSVTPQDIQFGKGKVLNAKRRVEIYRNAANREEGSDLEQFGKYLAKALDVKHYPSLETIGGSFWSIILGLSKSVLDVVFKS